MSQTPVTTAPDGRPTAQELRAAFDRAPRYTLGLEEEVMLLEPDSLELCPRAPQVLALLGGDPRFKLELPASQLEIMLPPGAGVSVLEAQLREARGLLAQRTEGIVVPAVAAVHPFSPGRGELNGDERYRHTIAEFGPIAARQLVCALQIHVSVGDSDGALAAYNALRSYLPLVAALAANAPFYEGVDTGLASVRPTISALLPRQGVPPTLDGWEDYAEALRWGSRSGSFPEPRTWWWELRPHPRFGTLELRVPDAQSTVADAGAVAGLVHALVVWLADRHAAGERLPVAPTWRIEENRWRACRDGVCGAMADLASGELRPTRELLHELLDDLAGTAQALGATAALQRADRLVERNGAMAQREVAREHGVAATARWLSDRFLT